MTVLKIATIQWFIGVSGDSKPTSAPTGSKFYETDTYDTYITTDDGTTWAVYKGKEVLL